MIVKKEISFPKELGEVLLLVKEIVKVVKEKGDYMSLIPQLISAVEGVDEIGEEVKDLVACGHAGVDFVFELVELFKAKEA